LAQSPLVAVAYVGIAALIARCTRLSSAPLTHHEIEAEHGGDLEPTGQSA
jgi:hypothetical protein